MQSYLIDRRRLPDLYPTHLHSPLFWEQLGRAVATYGFLEEVLGRAIFAFTATRRYNDDEIEKAYRAWLPQLERALTDQLWKLAEQFESVARAHPDSGIDVPALVQDIKAASRMRNVLCHGSWRKPDSNGAAVPFFVSNKMELFETAIDVAFLRQVQTHVAELACDVVESVTRLGWQFPGSKGLGRPIA